jgi:hypothetical protein
MGRPCCQVAFADRGVLTSIDPLKKIGMTFIAEGHFFVSVAKIL